MNDVFPIMRCGLEQYSINQLFVNFTYNFFVCLFYVYGRG
jgi:hypothetical protein